MADEAIPIWKRNFTGTKAKGDETKRQNRSLREDIDAVLASMAGDSLGRQAWLRQFAMGTAEDRRALLQARVRLEPTEVRGQIDTSLTVRVVTQLGTAVELKLGQFQNPKDAAIPLPAPTLAEGSRAPEDDGA